MSQALDAVTNLVKALEAGNYDAAPSTLVQGSALQIEDLSSVMNNVTFEQQHIKLQKKVTVVSCKSTLAQFDRQLSYGNFGGSAQGEGNIGQEETSDYVRVTVPMAFYSHTRKVSIASTMVATVDGKKSDERAAADAAIKLSADVEFDLFRGLDDFSNGGVFDGNPLTVPALPNIHGLGLQVRQSDFQANARDLMFAEYGSDDTVVLTAGGVLTQDKVEDAAVRSALNFGSAATLMVDPIVLSAYNKITFGKERIVLAGSPQDATGGDLRRQWVSGGTVNIEASQFLRGKAKPQRARIQNPNAPGIPTLGNFATPAAGTGLAAGDYVFYASSANEVGESMPSIASTQTLAAGDKVTFDITTPGGPIVRHFNVYRSNAGGTSASAKFIGRVAADPSGTTTFTDLGNKLPGFVTGYLIEQDTMELKELSSYSRIKLAVTELATPEGHFRFCTLATTKPRMNVLIDNLKGTL